MAETISARLKLVYEDATSRNYTFNGIDRNYMTQIKSNVKNLNISILGEMTDGVAFAETFVSDNGAKCVEISEARLIIKNQEVIYNAG